jgi:type IV pilus assembly protein PilA
LHSSIRMEGNVAMRNRQSGFTLIELLVVVSIIGILAAVAIPQYAGYKAQAVDASMESSLRNARTASEAFYVGTGGTYEGLTIAALLLNGFRISDGVDVDVVAAGPSAFQLRACAAGGSSPALLLDSNAGGAVPDSGACS